MTQDALVALFSAKIDAPPTPAAELLARHLECEQSMQLAAAMATALNRSRGRDGRRLVVPADLLPPLA